MALQPTDKFLVEASGVNSYIQFQDLITNIDREGTPALTAGDGIKITDLTPGEQIDVLLEQDGPLYFDSANAIALKVGGGLEVINGELVANIDSLSFKGSVDLLNDGDIPATSAVGDTYVNTGSSTDVVFVGTLWQARLGGVTTTCRPGDLIVCKTAGNASTAIFTYVPVGGEAGTGVVAEVEAGLGITVTGDGVNPVVNTKFGATQVTITDTNDFVMPYNLGLLPSVS